MSAGLDPPGRAPGLRPRRFATCLERAVGGGRRSHPVDRRSLLVEIIPDGRAVLQELRVRASPGAHVDGVLSSGELGAYIDVLHRIQDNVARPDPGQADP